MAQRKPNRGPAGAPASAPNAADEMQALAHVFASASASLEPEAPLKRLRPIAIWSAAGLIVVALGSFIAYSSLRPGRAREAFAGGQRLVAQGKYREAIAFFDKAVALDSRYADAYYARATTSGILGDDSKDVQDLNIVLRLRPDFAGAYFRRGDIYNQRGEFRRAIDDFSTVIGLRPDDGEAYAQRASAYRHLKDYPQAIGDYNKAIQCQPNVDNYYQRAAVFGTIGDNRKALSDLNTAIDLKPRAYFIYLARSSVRRALGDLAGSNADLQKALELQVRR